LWRIILAETPEAAAASPMLSMDAVTSWETAQSKAPNHGTPGGHHRLTFPQGQGPESTQPTL
jgi:hypothetical protein